MLEITRSITICFCILHMARVSVTNYHCHLLILHLAAEVEGQLHLVVWCLRLLGEACPDLKVHMVAMHSPLKECLSVIIIEL